MNVVCLQYTAVCCHSVHPHSSRSFDLTCTVQAEEGGTGPADERHATGNGSTAVAAAEAATQQPSQEEAPEAAGVAGWLGGIWQGMAGMLRGGSSPQQQATPAEAQHPPAVSPGYFGGAAARLAAVTHKTHQWLLWE